MTTHYCGCIVVCVVGDVVDVSSVASIDIVPCVVADGIVFYVVCVMVVAVFLVVCVMVDAVGFLIVIFNFYIGRRFKSGDFIVKLCFQSVYVIFEVTTPTPVAPVVPGVVLVMGLRCPWSWTGSVDCRVIVGA